MMRNGYIYAHFSRLPGGFDYYTGYRERASRRVVQDRFHLSEIMYAAARGDETSLSPERYRLVDGFLRELGAYTVVVTTTETELGKRFEAIGDDMYDFDVVRAANHYFMQTAQTSGMFLRDGRAWNVDVDLHVHCPSGYPTDVNVNAIVTNYIRRQDSCQSAMRNWRPW